MFPDYEAFLSTFQEQNYSIEPLIAGDLATKRVLYLRHDIDFDVELALEMARIEARRGTRATYFLMLTSDSYNIFSARNAACVAEIKALGHKISIHCDPTRYDDFEAGLRQEVVAFEAFFDCRVDLISLHRPSDFFLAHDQEIGGIAHTYQSKYIREVQYFADSRGTFRYGPPNDTEAFARGESIHLVIHPIWRIIPSPTPQEAPVAFTERRISLFQKYIQANCVTYSRAASRIQVVI